MSIHARSRSFPREESFVKEFQKLHHVKGIEVIIGLCLMRRLKEARSPFRTKSPALRSLSELLDIIVQLLIVGR